LLPDPFEPGESFEVELTDLREALCEAGSTITIEFTSNESNCQQVVDVPCQDPPG
jgi:hypothetical protein